MKRDPTEATSRLSAYSSEPPGSELLSLAGFVALLMLVPSYAHRSRTPVPMFQITDTIADRCVAQSSDEALVLKRSDERKQPIQICLGQGLAYY